MGIRHSNGVNQNHNQIASSHSIFCSTSDHCYITLYYQDIEFRFLIDTGASSSLIKLEKLKQTKSKYNPTEILTLNGLSANTPVKTIGSIVLNTRIHNKFLDIKFHIVKQESNIPFDGLIGQDFLKQEGAEINYSQGFLKIKSLPFPVKLQLSSKKESGNSYILNPRSETVIQVDILNSGITQGICPEVVLYDGVYIAKAIVKVDSDNKALTTVLNTRDCEMRINKLKLTLEPFNEKTCSVFLTNNSNQKSLARPERLELLKSNLRVSHLNSEEKDSIEKICTEYNDIFFLPNDKLTCTKLIQHEINVSDPTPTHSKYYRYPEIHKKEVDKQIDKMLKQGIIRPSVSPYSSPLWVVKKKQDASGEEKYRVVVDYRDLNSKTIGDAYPLPNIEEILDQLGHSKYFSTLDLASGFHQIEMKESDIHKTAFSTPTGHYEFTRMPFGLKTAPACFQRMMSLALTGLQGLQCYVYLDDIVIYASSLKNHTEKLRCVFDRLRNNNLLLQPDKCEFLKREVAYLGHIISDKGVSPNPEKTKAVALYPTPRNPKQIKQFLGLCGYYRRFIPDFSKIAKPLTLLLKKDAPFQWLQPQQESFEEFKKTLTSKLILRYPKFDERFILTTDSSNYAIGAILSQGEVGKDLPVSYASRTLNKSECNYSTIEKELLAIVWATNHFRPYLYGRKFLILTDARSLCWLFKCRDASSRLVRWRLKLEEFDYEIQYKPGRVNSNVDALSRNPVLTFFPKKSETYDNFIRFHYENDKVPDVQIIKENIFDKNPKALIYSKDLSNENIYFENLQSTFDINKIPEDVQLYDCHKLTNHKNENLYLLISKLNHYDKLSYKDIFYSLQNFRDKLVLEKNKEIYLKNPVEGNENIKQDMFNEMIDFLFSRNKIKVILVNKPKLKPQSKDEIKQILEQNHTSSISGHAGYLRTYTRIKENYKWPNMKKDIKNFIKCCSSCQINKTNHKPGKAPMEITTTSERPFQRLAIDIVGPLPITLTGNRFILTMQDDLTKFSYAQALENHEAITVANKLIDFITIFGIPETLLSDQGADFCSNIIKELNRLFKIKHIFSSPYHPQSNGALEKSHLTLKEYLKHYINSNQNDWDEYVNLAMFTYNTHIHKSTQFSPYELIFGHKAFIPNTISSQPEFKYTYDDYYSSLKLKFNKAHQIARENIIKSKEKSKIYYDKKLNDINYKINDLVYILDKQTKPGLSKKLSPNYKGPYKIIKVFDNKNVLVEIKSNKHVRYHVNLLKPFVSDD